MPLDVLGRTRATLTEPASTPLATATGTPDNNNGDDIPCTTPGGLVCVGDSQFGICNNLFFLDVHVLNPEQKCVDGQVVFRAI